MFCDKRVGILIRQSSTGGNQDTWMVVPFGNYCESFDMSRAEQSDLWGREWVKISSLIVNPHRLMVKDD